MTTRQIETASLQVVKDFVTCLYRSDVAFELSGADVPNGENRRAASRYAVQLAVTIQQFDKDQNPISAPLDSETQDISQGGMSFANGEPIAVGTHLMVTLKDYNGQMDVVSEVRHCRQDGDTFCVGVAFLFDEM